MKFKIPEIRRRHSVQDTREDEHSAEEVLDELESATEETPVSEPEPEKVKSYGMVISEAQLRMIWAGEIGFSLLIVFAALVIAFVN